MLLSNQIQNVKEGIAGQNSVDCRGGKGEWKHQRWGMGQVFSIATASSISAIVYSSNNWLMALTCTFLLNNASISSFPLLLLSFEVLTPWQIQPCPPQGAGRGFPERPELCIPASLLLPAFAHSILSLALYPRQLQPFRVAGEMVQEDALAATTTISGYVCTKLQVWCLDKYQWGKWERNTALLGCGITLFGKRGKELLLQENMWSPIHRGKDNPRRSLE